MPVEGIIQPPLGVGSGLGNSCSPNFSWWQVGTRTQWNPHPDLDIGIDVTWNHLNTAYKGLGDPGALGVVSGVALSANGVSSGRSGLRQRSGRDQRLLPRPAQLPALSRETSMTTRAGPAPALFIFGTCPVRQEERVERESSPVIASGEAISLHLLMHLRMRDCSQSSSLRLPKARPEELAMTPIASPSSGAARG